MIKKILPKNYFLYILNENTAHDHKFGESGEERRYIAIVELTDSINAEVISYVFLQVQRIYYLKIILKTC